MTTLLHLVYIHGFQGNDTSFQSFPLHLQEHLSSRIPPGSSFRIQSSLYPTYKSVKPISHATRNFLEWLSTQPEGPVIVIGHSMGGLLAADAALDPSNAIDPSTGRPKRIIGVIAFDTPFLGMHPHVVISGIASLLPNDSDEEKAKEDKKLDKHPEIHIVSDNVTDEWEDMKKKIHRRSRQQFDTNVSPHLDIPARGGETSPTPSLYSQSSSTLSHRSRSRSPSPFLERAIDLVASYTDPEDPFVRWFRKHADDPLRASKRWMVERFQFGGCMFDPSGLKSRYTHLTSWQGGLWINYWTQTVPPGAPTDSDSAEREDQASNDEALVENGIVSDPTSNTRKGHRASNKLRKLKDGTPATVPAKTPRHFVVLPTGLGQHIGGFERWEKVLVAGAQDEVEAHCGLFIPTKNLEYSTFVHRVADRILGWVDSAKSHG
ncbi:hypothetical protein FA15DRAFT_752622 [Coprinopsis marcescibilis]|uniref:AB hydrolase-1 domain-containing protein n=1 Tax=Coprinopsis marcescibilis TaxID=230819 RepID=A0A5C3L8Y9_COPMA|nr:hypothetical protein FA15DRAFT_752622 [Coprinopsis marcescibilis]